MTDFEKWVSAQPPTLHDMFWVAAAFQAGQRAEREKRKPLTDEEIFDLENALPDEDMCSDRKWTLGLARAIERRINGEEG